MSQRFAIDQQAGTTGSARGDRGMSFVELLVAIVLLGTAIVGTLAALRASIIASTVERDRAQSQQWLQSATDVLLNDVEWGDCATSSGAALQATYQADLNAAVDTPVSVTDAVSFGQPDGSFGPTCFPEIDRQLVRLTITGDDGSVVQTVAVVKSPPWGGS